MDHDKNYLKRIDKVFEQEYVKLENWKKERVGDVGCIQCDKQKKANSHFNYCPNCGYEYKGWE